LQPPQIAFPDLPADPPPPFSVSAKAENKIEPNRYTFIAFAAMSAAFAAVPPHVLLTAVPYSIAFL
jgi:hypothetical protein